jgi:hypothetical protein
MWHQQWGTRTTELPAEALVPKLVGVAERLVVEAVAMVVASKSKAAWFPSASHHSQKWLGLG